jgi:hypothetical protein
MEMESLNFLLEFNVSAELAQQNRTHSYRVTAVKTLKQQTPLASHDCCQLSTKSTKRLPSVSSATSLAQHS